jgi:hypothetical protein
VNVVLKRGAKLFAAFCAVVVAAFALLFVPVAGLDNFAFLILVLLTQPAIMIRQWLFEIPGAELQYHYYSAMGLVDYSGMLGFYFFVCVALAWCWTRAKSKWASR